MRAFVDLEAIAAPLPMSNLDTDKILPARFLKTISREGLGAGLFADLRTDADFILNRAPWNKAEILIALDNFGCGSSREHAPWALLDFGIRCVIARSFADIFYNNCFKNGILPIVLAADAVDALLTVVATPSTANLTVDLRGQLIVTASHQTIPFVIDAKRKQDLLLGVDEIEASLKLESKIDEFESDRISREPWLSSVAVMRASHLDSF